jgi:hypothetical protein
MPRPHVSERSLVRGAGARPAAGVEMVRSLAVRCVGGAVTDQQKRC